LIEQECTLSEIEYKNAWQKSDPKLIEDAVSLWNAHNVMTRGIDPADRVSEICALAYFDAEPIGVATINIRRFGQVRSNIAFARCFVTPDHREKDAARWLMVRCKEYVGAWSKENQELGVRGMAVVVQSPKLVPIARDPVWENTLLGLVGFTKEGDQVRLTWFDHVKFPDGME
jgi:hypothetical protein